MKHFQMVNRREHYKPFGMFPQQADLRWIEGNIGVRYRANLSPAPDGVTTTFSIPVAPSGMDPSNLIIFKNGSLFGLWSMSISSTQQVSIIFATAPAIGEAIVIYVL